MIYQPDFFQTILQQLSAEKNEFASSTYISHRPCSGGCINTCFELITSARSFFLKVNHRNMYPQMFEKEAAGLTLLSQHTSMHIPEVIHTGNIDSNSYLLLEYVQTAKEEEHYWELFGMALAEMHTNSHSVFGLDYENYIGSLPQKNSTHEKWINFFILNRLSVLVEKAYNNQLLHSKAVRQFDKLYSKLEQLIPEEPPALLHGDLWSGNVITNKNGSVCLIDPAVYYGHREAEIAFTGLFGGFPFRFYEAYHSSYPLQPEWRKRVDIFNLYPLLVHLILFGSSYANSITSTLNHYT